MRLISNIILPAVMLVLILTGCATTKDVAYVQTAEQEITIASRELHDAKIMPKDILTITIQANNPEAVAAFNGFSGGVLPQGGAGTQVRKFLVDNSGSVDIPVIGLINLSNLTLRQAESKIKASLTKYVRDVTSVNIQILNYRYSVLGEVNHSGTFTADNTKVTLFEALSNAGDMTIYGQSKTVRLMREAADGTKTVVTLNLQDPEILNSPYYYLQQGDVIYIMPNNAKASSRNVSSGTTIWFSIASLGFSVINILLTVLRK